MGCRSAGTESRLVSMEADGVAFSVSGARTVRCWPDLSNKLFWNIGQLYFYI